MREKKDVGQVMEAVGLRMHFKEGFQGRLLCEGDFEQR